MQNECIDGVVVQALHDRADEREVFFRDAEAMGDCCSIDELIPLLGSFHEDRALVLMNRRDHQKSAVYIAPYIVFGAYAVKPEDIVARKESFLNNRYARTTIQIFSDLLRRHNDAEALIQRYKTNLQTALFVDACYAVAVKISMQ